MDRRDAGGVITAIFETLQAIEKPFRHIFLSDDTDNSAHASQTS
jgi:hypothetical protein